MADIPVNTDPVTYLASQNKPVLKQFLQQHGITVGDKRKDKLLDLCIRAHTLGLPRKRVEEDVNKQGSVKLNAPGSTPMMEACMSAASAPRRPAWTLDLMSHGYYWQRIVMPSQENVLVQHKLNLFCSNKYLCDCLVVARWPSCPASKQTAGLGLERNHVRTAP